MIPFLEDRAPESRSLIRTIEFEYDLYADFDLYSWWYRHVCELLSKESIPFSIMLLFSKRLKEDSYCQHVRSVWGLYVCVCVKLGPPCYWLLE